MPLAPWVIIRSNDKKKARLNCIKYILHNLDYEGKIHESKLKPDPEIVISGIDELKHMEDNLLKPIELPGWGASLLILTTRIEKSIFFTLLEDPDHKDMGGNAATNRYWAAC